MAIPKLIASDISNLRKISFGVISPSYNPKKLLQDEALLDKYRDYIIEVWHPEPTKTETHQKKLVAKEYFNALFSEWCSERGGQGHLVANGRGLEDCLTSLSTSFEVSKREKGGVWEQTANPYLTVMVEKSYKEGQVFQKGAKIASSVETKWGNWVEGVFMQYNPNLLYIGAAGTDFILNNTAYDVKSGPNVMNLDQVKQATTKRHIIQEMGRDEDLKEVVAVRDFKVAIAYGNIDIAGSPMKNAEDGLIIYGADAWRELTGDEYNAFDLFLCSIEHMVKNGAEWDASDLEGAVASFNSVFYMGEREKLRSLRGSEKYVALLERITS